MTARRARMGMLVVSGTLAFLVSGATAQERGIIQDIAIPGRAYPHKNWSPDDLLSGREDVLAPLRARVGEIRRDPIVTPRGAGTMDIGEIAVLEDDGTLVVGGVTDIFAIANAFYATHTDEYDEIIAFVASTFPGDIEPEAGFAFYLGQASFTANINAGQGNPNEGGGITRLLGLVNMNDLPEYPASPTTDFLGGVASGVEILGQESEHAFGAFVQAQGADILGRGEAHWSFYLSHPGVGNGSPMEGNRWQDNGDGTFTTVESFTGLSELDEYLMGLRAPATMQPFFLITPPPALPFADSTFPAPGVTVSGTRQDLDINDIIALNGARIPDTSTSMKVLKLAFILVIPNGTTADAGDLAKLDAFHLAWENYFATETEGLGSIDSTLAPGPITNLPFADTFDAAVPDTNNWIYVQGATHSDLGIGEPSGNSSLRLNGQAGGGDEVRSRVIDLSGFSPGDVTVNYSVERTGGGESPDAGEDLLVEYFNNAQAWVVLRSFDGNGPDEATFSSFSDPLPADALHSQFRLRFHRLQGSIGDFDDYFVDDVSIVGVGGFVAADLDMDGDVDADDFTMFAQCFGGSNNPPAPTCPVGVDADFDNDGDVDSGDFTSFSQCFGGSNNPPAGGCAL